MFWAPEILFVQLTTIKTSTKDNKYDGGGQDDDDGDDENSHDIEPKKPMGIKFLSNS